MTLDFYQQLRQLLTQGPVTVATVVRTRGSVPREVGAKMWIAPGHAPGSEIVGEIGGTIGGGAGEAKVIAQALQVLRTGAKQFVEIDLSGAPQRQTQGVCGGWMQVWLERWAGAGAIALVDQIQTHLQSGQAAMLVTPFCQHRHPFIDPQMVGDRPLVSDEILQEPLLPPPTLLIIGAGHVGVALAQVAHLAGFQIAVQDDRPEFARADRLPPGCRLLVGAIAPTLAQFPCHPQVYVALVTRGYPYDVEALQLLLALPPQHHPRYVGMIGSVKRVRLVQQSLGQQGVSAAQLAQLHAPIGLDIGALTPAEIAVSICAELIQVRRGGSGIPLSAERLAQEECGVDG